MKHRDEKGKVTIKLQGPTHVVPNVKSKEEYDKWLNNYYVRMEKTINEVFDSLKKEEV